LDNKTECIQSATLDKSKYRNAEYDDKTVDNLMKYFEAESYEELEKFLKNCHIPLFD
jgi:hypothetical protein